MVAAGRALGAGEGPPGLAAAAGVCEFARPAAKEGACLGQAAQVCAEEAEAVPVGEEFVGDAHFAD